MIDPISNEVYNLSGIQKLWIALKPSNFSYFVKNATFQTVDAYGNNIDTIESFPTGVTVNFNLISESFQEFSFTQDVKFDKQGLLFLTNVKFTIPRIDNTKLNELTNYIQDKDILIVFKDNNNFYYVIGADSNVRIKKYSKTTGEYAEDNMYDLEFESVNDYTLYKYINPSLI
jgi:hypothetical protein